MHMCSSSPARDMFSYFLLLCEDGSSPWWEMTLFSCVPSLQLSAVSSAPRFPVPKHLFFRQLTVKKTLRVNHSVVTLIWYIFPMGAISWIFFYVKVSTSSKLTNWHLMIIISPNTRSFLEHSCTFSTAFSQDCFLFLKFKGCTDSDI